MADITKRILSDSPEDYEDEEGNGYGEDEYEGGQEAEEQPDVRKPIGRPKSTKGGARETKAKEPTLPEGFTPVKRVTIPELKVGGVMPGAGGVLIGAVIAGFNPEYIIDNRKFIHFKTWDWNYSQYGTRFSTLLHSYRDVNVDLIVGSPSCAKFSRRGKKIIDGKPLEEVPPEIFEYVQFLEEMVLRRPRFFVLENVPGVRRYFWFEEHPEGGYVLRSEKFKTGIWLRDYEIQEEFMDTHEFGLPQFRKRLYLIGSLKNYEFTYKPPKRIKEINLIDAIDDIKDRLGALVNHEPPEHDEERIKSFKTLKPGETAYSSFGNKRLTAHAPAPTITGGSTRFIHYSQDRIITPRECARIMGFPDDYVFWGGILQQYDQIGKGVAPPVITHIATQIMETLSKKGQLAIPDVFKPKKRWLPKIRISLEREV